MMAQNVRVVEEGQIAEPRTGEHTPANGESRQRTPEATLNVVMDTVISKFKWGNGIGTTSYSQLYLYIKGIDTPVALEFDDSIILGRQAATTESEQPTLDLTPFGGNEKGVSRTHAAIQRMKNSVVLVDLGSANKSYINGQRIVSNQPHVLIEGDEIRLGNFVASISYGPSKQSR